MKFSDKLNYLMNITQTANKELAKSIFVDPSLISLLRSGKRGNPQNPNHIKNMADFFSKKCTLRFQRNAVSEMLGIPALRSSVPLEVFSKHLELWLKKDSDFIETIASEIENIPEKINVQIPKSELKEQNDASFYFGEEGRRKVMRSMMNIILNMKNPASVLITSDDNLEWLLSDYTLTKQMQSWIFEVIEKGFTFHQIMPAINFLPRYTESLKFWLPMYSTGKIKVYYYPRLRDNLYRRSMIVIPGTCVRISSAVGLGSSSDLTMFSTDEKVVNSYVMQFNEILSMCRPAINVLTERKDIYKPIEDFFEKHTDYIELSKTPSIFTLPEKLLSEILKNKNLSPEIRKAFSNQLKNSSVFEEKLKTKTFINISKLSSVEDIIEGKVPIGSESILFDNQPFYTLETYIIHLKYILYLLQEYENFYFIDSEEIWGNYNLLVNEDGFAYLYKSVKPSLLLEFRRPELVYACYEYLIRKAEKYGYSGISKTKIIYTIQSRIKELSSLKVNEGGGIIKRNKIHK